MLNDFQLDATFKVLASFQTVNFLIYRFKSLNTYSREIYQYKTLVAKITPLDSTLMYSQVTFASTQNLRNT